MAIQNSLFFLGLCLFTLVGFIIRSLSNYTSDNTSINPGLKLMSQATVVVLTMVLWSILIFFK